MTRYATPEGIVPGQRFGELTVISFAGRDKAYRAKFSVRCSCGSETVVLGSGMKKGNTSRCNAGIHRIDHGMYKSPEYQAWKSMNSRGRGDSGWAHKHYVDKGIDVYGLWKTSFADFFSHIGPMPSPGLEVDRVNNNSGYVPGNVRWASRSQQMRNTELTRTLTVGGITKPEVEWAEIAGMPVTTLRYRVNKKWPESELFLPANARRETVRCA